MFDTFFTVLLEMGMHSEIILLKQDQSSLNQIGGICRTKLFDTPIQKSPSL